MTDETKESIKCDSCGNQLITHTSNPANYALELKCINTNRNPFNSVNLVNMFPLINKPKHFCGFRCLSTYLEERETK